MILVNVGSGYGLVYDGMKPLPDHVGSSDIYPRVISGSLSLIWVWK